VRREATNSTKTQALVPMRREDFAEILNQQVTPDMPLVYLDNAATSQKPACVIDAVRNYYTHDNSNVHRGVHTLSARATDAFEEARASVARLINASTPSEVVWTRNASEAINLVALTYGASQLKEGDAIVLSVAEHHSNIVPWQLLAQKNGVELRYARLDADERVDEDHVAELMEDGKVKLVAIAHVSNVLGSTLDVPFVVDLCRKHGAKLLLDACQSVPHMPIDVQSLGADFVVASGHKMCAPTGTGFLWAKYETLDELMPPLYGGGEMIEDVSTTCSTYAKPPLKFEAGTPAIGEMIGLGRAAEYLMELDMREIHAYECELGAYLYERLAADVPNIRLYGPSPAAARASGSHASGLDRAALCAFTHPAAHANDLSTLLDSMSGIAIRSGHHCTQPLHKEALGVLGTARASLYFYNSPEEVDFFVKELNKVVDFFEEVAA